MMSGNHNIGWKAVEADSDILNLNDDIYFLEPNPIAKYQELAYSEPKIGCVSAYAKAGAFGQPLQMRPRQDVPMTFVKTSSNGCTYFRRDMINEVGWYDETFDGKYWKVAIARDLPVKHGYGNVLYSSTAARAIPDQGRQALEGVEQFKRKHGHWDVIGEWAW
jgi:GT2 family glycosyltransferase